MKSRKPETPLKDTYAHIYAHHRGYGMCSRVKKGLALTLERFAAPTVTLSGTVRGSYVDVGCGRGESLRMARAAGYTDVYGLEIVSQLTVPAHVLLISEHDATFPFHDDSIDLVTCLDVLEHIPEHAVEFTIRELWRITRRAAVLSIPWNASTLKWTGTDLHLTKQKPEWWIPHLRAWCPLAVVSVWEELAAPATAWYTLERLTAKDLADTRPPTTQGEPEC